MNDDAPSRDDDDVERFAKLSSAIIHSSIWAESGDICKVWVTLLALANLRGYVAASRGGIARAAVLPLEVVDEALAKFMSPDPDSRDPANEGRRLALAPRGFQILNYQKHRDRGHDRVEAERERKRKWWREHRGKGSPTSQPPSTSDGPPDSGSALEHELDAPSASLDTSSESMSGSASGLSSGSDRSVRPETSAARSARAEQDDATSASDAHEQSSSSDPWGLAPPGEPADVDAPKTKRPKREKRQKVGGKPRTMPDDFAPNEKHAGLAAKLGVDLSFEQLRFEAHHRARGSLFIDWDAALRTWLLNAKRFADRDRGSEQTETAETPAQRKSRREAEAQAAIDRCLGKDG